MKNNNVPKNRKQKNAITGNSIIEQRVKKFFKENKVFKKKNEGYKFGVNIQKTPVVFFESETNHNLRDVKSFIIDYVSELQIYSEFGESNFLDLLFDNRKEIDKPLFQDLDTKAKTLVQKKKSSEGVFIDMAILNTDYSSFTEILKYLDQLGEKRVFELNMLTKKDRKLDFFLFGKHLFTLDSRKPHEKKIMLLCMKLAKGHYTLSTAFDATELQAELSSGKISNYVTSGTKSQRTKYRNYLNQVIARNYSGTKYFIYPHIEILVKK